MIFCTDQFTGMLLPIAETHHRRTALFCLNEIMQQRHTVHAAADNRNRIDHLFIAPRRVLKTHQFHNFPINSNSHTLNGI